MIDKYFDAQGYATEEISFETQTDLFDVAEEFHEKIYLNNLESIDEIRTSFRDYCSEKHLNEVEQKLLAEALLEYWDLEAISMFLD